MDEDEEVSDVYRPSLQLEEEPDSVDKQELAGAEQCEPVPELDDSPLDGGASPLAEREGEDAIAEEDPPMADTEMETETEVADTETEAADIETEAADIETEGVEIETEVAEAEMEVAETGRGGGGKRKRGRNSRAPARAPPRKKVEEDVCFICFDGGDLVLCDRRGCPKAYHPSCVNRDEAFFRAKGRWNCGWHLCSRCEKNAYYMCYTCTFSLCKLCTKDAVIFCVRGNKGFCEACMRTVMLIEKNEQGNKEMTQVDFDDKSSWEYLFKDYWIDLKGKLCLTSDELAQAKNPWKGSDVLAGKQESPDELYDANNDGGSDSDSSSENLEASKPKRRKAKKPSKSLTKEGGSPSAAIAEGSAVPGSIEWASKELMEFVMHMKNGDKSVLSQFDVQALLLEYIKRNKLRDPRRKSQIICDSRLENLFGKARVGHFEMLKLLESHFLIKEDLQADDLQGSVVDTEASQLEVDGNADVIMKAGKDRRRKMRKKGDERGPQSNLDDYAAIDMHNINLIYLRRNLMEDLVGDNEKFHEKVVGSFVRIRISGSVQKQDIYRLVQVVGTSKAAEPYKVGKRNTDIMLEILNLNKTEIISIDIISNQEFTEDECKRLRQSIKCGLINRLTVGDVLEKAMALHAVRINDCLETEIVRLSHLRDRASETGRRKEECVEKLQLLKTAEERQRRLEEIPGVHADPNMDPSHESEEDEEENDKKQEIYMRPRGTGFGRRGREPVSPGTGGSASNDSWSGTRKNSNKDWELGRNLSNKGFSNRGEDATAAAEIINENSWNQGRDRDTQQSSSGEKLKTAANSETSGWNGQVLARSESFSGVGLATSAGPLAAGAAQFPTKINETEKIWHYRDPSGKVQGPFSMLQLRKWSNTGYFPVDLRIWRTTEKQDDSILLTDVLAEFFPKDQPVVDDGFSKAQQVHNPHLPTVHSGKPYGTPLQQGREIQGGEKPNFDQNRDAGNLHSTVASLGQSAGENWRSQLEVSSSNAWATPSSVETPKFSRDKWTSDYGSRNDSLNLPSPTPTQSSAAWTGGQASENKQPANSFPAQQAGSVLGSNPFPGGNGALPSSALLTAESGQMMHSSNPSSSLINLSGGADGSHVSHSSLNQQSSVPGNNEHSAIGIVLPTLVSNSGGLAMRGSENDSSSLTGLSPTPKSESGVSLSSINALQNPSQSTVPSESDGVRADIHPHPAPDLAAALISAGADAKNAGISLPNLGPGSVSKPEQIASCQIPGGEAQAWGSAPSQKLEPNTSIPVPVQQSVYGHWAPPPSSVHNSASSFSAGNPAGSFPIPGFSSLPPSDPWRPPVTGNQWETGSNVRPPALPNLPWSMGAAENPGAAPGLRPDNPNTVWGPIPGNPNMAWGGPAPASANVNWGAGGQGPAPGNVNPGPAPGSANLNWGAALQGPAPGNTNPGPAPGSTNVNWGAVGQGPLPGNANPVPTPGSTNMSWGASGQGPVPGNANAGWVAPAGNPGAWGSDQNQNGDRFSSQRDRAYQGGDSGYGAGRPWNRQLSYGSGGAGGSSRPPPKGQRVCKYHENGHCKKGASCDYLHT